MAKEYTKTRKLKWELWPSLSNIPDILSAAKVFSVAYAWSQKTIEKSENLNKELVNRVSNKAKEMNTETRLSEYQIADITSAAYAYAKKKRIKAPEDKRRKNRSLRSKRPDKSQRNRGNISDIGEGLGKRNQPDRRIERCRLGFHVFGDKRLLGRMLR